jgi:SHS family lactate transporter-like MFS transporter
MSTSVHDGRQVAWWQEPTREQWHAWVAAWLGWTLDSFDFTIFVFIMLPISQEFHVPLTAVTAVFTLTLWLRLIGATGSGWLADRIGRKKPLMISIAWFSACNFIAGFSPSFAFLFLFRALLGIGMGAEWPVGASLALENWPIRSRGFMAGVMQGSWGLGALLSAAAYGLLFDSIGWRGLLWIGVLPALLIVYVRKFVVEPPIWVENRRLQRTQNREVRMPLVSIFKRGLLANTLTACWWMASSFVVGYSIGTLFATYLQKDLHLSPGLVARRDQHIQEIAVQGRMGWQKPSGYNVRAKVEAAIGRYKRVIGDALRSRTDETEATEVAIAARVLNQMLGFGRPKYVRTV